MISDSRLLYQATVSYHAGLTEDLPYFGQWSIEPMPGFLGAPISDQEERESREADEVGLDCSPLC